MLDRRTEGAVDKHALVARNVSSIFKSADALKGQKHDLLLQAQANGWNRSAPASDIA